MKQQTGNVPRLSTYVNKEVSSKSFCQAFTLKGIPVGPVGTHPRPVRGFRSEPVLSLCPAPFQFQDGRPYNWKASFLRRDEPRSGLWRPNDGRTASRRAPTLEHLLCDDCAAATASCVATGEGVDPDTYGKDGWANSRARLERSHPKHAVIRSCTRIVGGCMLNGHGPSNARTPQAKAREVHDRLGHAGRRRVRPRGRRPRPAGGFSLRGHPRTGRSPWTGFASCSPWFSSPL